MNKAMLILFGVMLLSFFIGAQWNNLSWLRDGVHKVLDPSFGALLSWNIYIGMIIIVFIITFASTGVHKLTVNPEEMRLMKERQKFYSDEMKKYKGDAVKLKEVQMKQMAELPDMFSKNIEITMKPLLFTLVPIILFFRWFSDYFTTLGNPKFFGFLHWILFYILVSILLNGPIRKIYKM